MRYFQEKKIRQFIPQCDGSWIVYKCMSCICSLDRMIKVYSQKYSIIKKKVKIIFTAVVQLSLFLWWKSHNISQFWEYQFLESGPFWIPLCISDEGLAVAGTNPAWEEHEEILFSPPFLFFFLQPSQHLYLLCDGFLMM